MKKIIFTVIAGLGVFSCTAPDTATKALENEGYTEIQITGYKFFGCSDTDKFHTGFRAKNSKGKVVEGTVCSGILKGATIRY